MDPRAWQDGVTARELRLYGTDARLLIADSDDRFRIAGYGEPGSATMLWPAAAVTERRHIRPAGER